MIRCYGKTIQPRTFFSSFRSFVGGSEMDAECSDNAADAEVLSKPSGVLRVSDGVVISELLD